MWLTLSTVRSCSLSHWMCRLRLMPSRCVCNSRYDDHLVLFSVSPCCIHSAGGQAVPLTSSFQELACAHGLENWELTASHGEVHQMGGMWMKTNCLSVLTLLLKQCTPLNLWQWLVSILRRSCRLTCLTYWTHLLKSKLIPTLFASLCAGNDFARIYWPVLYLLHWGTRSETWCLGCLSPNGQPCQKCQTLQNLCIHSASTTFADHQAAFAPPPETRNLSLVVLRYRHPNLLGASSRELAWWLS